MSRVNAVYLDVEPFGNIANKYSSIIKAHKAKKQERKWFMKIVCESKHMRNESIVWICEHMVGILRRFFMIN